jgi:glutamate synthase (NADPH/NADH) large chain
MTGGEAFLLDADESLLNDELVVLEPVARPDADRLLRLLERHHRATGSARAASLLADRDASLGRFRRLAPREQVAEQDEAEDGRLTA